MCRSDMSKSAATWARDLPEAFLSSLSLVTMSGLYTDMLSVSRCPEHVRHVPRAYEQNPRGGGPHPCWFRPPTGGSGCCWAQQRIGRPSHPRVGEDVAPLEGRRLLHMRIEQQAVRVDLV